MEHISVFNNEVVTGMNLKPDGVYVDATLGAGGHAARVLTELNSGSLIAFDLEQAAIDSFIAEQQLTITEQSDDVTHCRKDEATVVLVNHNFANLAETLAELNITAVDAIIADLGWSSDQLESIPGLSYQNLDQPLDMRLDQTQRVTAADIVNTIDVKQLAQMLQDYADFGVNESKRIAQAIHDARKRQPIKLTQDLVTILEHKSLATHGQTRNLLARVFQALRIVVNSELSSLQSFAPQALEALKGGGILQIITFHSGEANLVEKQMRDWVAEGYVQILRDKLFIQPTVAELRANIRAHSAKLWGIIKN